MTKDIEKDFAINDILTKDEPKIAMNIEYVEMTTYIWVATTNLAKQVAININLRSG